MKRVILFTLLIFSLSGCFKNPIKTGAIAEENRINLSSLAIGMSQQQVLDTMGYPYKTEEKVSQNKVYEVWYYITERTLLGQSRLITRNFTPVVFEAGRLIGWGNNFYKYTFDIDDERQKRKEEKRQEYTDDRDEWPKNDHVMIPSLNESKSSKSKEEQPMPSQPSQSSPTTSEPKTSQPSSNSTPASQTKEGKNAKTDNKKSEASSSEKAKDSETNCDFFEEKPPCCLKKAKEVSPCDKSKEPCSSAQKTPSKESKKPACEDKDKGYNFWE